MDIEEWWPWYEELVKTFGYDKSEDQRATDVLSGLLIGRSMDLEDLRGQVQSRRVLVLGAGPSLEGNLRCLARLGRGLDAIMMAADGATTAVLRILSRAPDVVITDLDGRVEDIVSASASGAIVIVHGHGDNIPALRTYVPMLKGRVLGTTQVEPRPRVYNFGGFTDGDRCVFLAEAMGASSVVLAGMDLGAYVGKYSKPHLIGAAKADRVKRLKLDVAKQLLEWIATWAKADLINVTGRGERIEGIRDSTLEELLSRTKG